MDSPQSCGDRRTVPKAAAEKKRAYRSRPIGMPVFAYVPQVRQHLSDPVSLLARVREDSPPADRSYLLMLAHNGSLSARILRCFGASSRLQRRLRRASPRSAAHPVPSTPVPDLPAVRSGRQGSSVFDCSGDPPPGPSRRMVGRLPPGVCALAVCILASRTRPVNSQFLLFLPFCPGTVDFRRVL